MIDAGIIDQESTSELILISFWQNHNRFVVGESQGSCGFSVYAQIVPSEMSIHDMEDLEDELQTPTGRWTVKRPPLILNGVLLSPECGILYHLHDVEGLRYYAVPFILSP